MGLVKTVREVANETGRFMGNRFTPGMAMFGRGLGDLLAARLSFRRAGAIVGGFGVPLAQAYTMAYMHTGDHLSAAFNTPFALIIDPGEGKTKKQIQFINPESSHNNAIKDELTAFYYAIENNTETIVTIEDAYNALVVAHQIAQQIK